MEEETAAWILASMKNPNLLNELRKRETPQDLPPVQKLDGIIGQCSQLYEKVLTPSDTNSDLARLLFNTQFAVTSLLPLLNEDENPIDGIGVTVYDLNGKEFQMMFKFWASKYYVLTQGWMAFCRDHDISNKDIVKLQMFRHLKTRRLCFVISTVKTTN
ncbi:hypothetical protein FH972_016244 [Carpinus fangiana]|uniref:TF-B3 domain-containing protein n=1 Tax=Carpinus fangiana TaxID=176857 RepID=A0A5N6RI28_9ROSI|nr:hypothetical protein FH972_016244 [Carpinus fangiana]